MAVLNESVLGGLLYGVDFNTRLQAPAIRIPYVPLPRCLSSRPELLTTSDEIVLAFGVISA